MKLLVNLNLVDKCDLLRCMFRCSLCKEYETLKLFWHKDSPLMFELIKKFRITLESKDIKLLDNIYTNLIENTKIYDPNDVIYFLLLRLSFDKYLWVLDTPIKTKVKIAILKARAALDSTSDKIVFKNLK